jgi:hypothetical protein
MEKTKPQRGSAVQNKKQLDQPKDAMVQQCSDIDPKQMEVSAGSGSDTEENHKEQDGSSELTILKKALAEVMQEERD